VNTKLWPLLNVSVIVASDHWRFVKKKNLKDIRMLYCGLCLKFTFTLKEVPITNQQLYINHLWGSLSDKCRYLEGTLSLKKAILTKTNRLLWESVTLATILVSN